MDREYWIRVLQERISRNNPAIDVEFGPVYDVFVAPVADALADLSVELERLRALMDFSRWKEWSDNDLDNLAKNFGLVRRKGSKAYGQVVFYSIVRPNVDVVIPKGTMVSTPDGLVYLTINDLVVEKGFVDRYKNPYTGRYEFEVYVEAQKEGEEYNVAAGNVTVLTSGGVSGVSGVVNKVSMKGGTNSETNEMLMKRIQWLVSGGVDPTTLNGLKLRVCFNDYVRDVYVEVLNPFVEGEIDVWILGKKWGYVVESMYYFGRDLMLSKAPVEDVVEVKSGVTMYSKGVDYQLVKDDTSYYGRTVRARDRIKWTGSVRPMFGTEVTVSYVRNELLEEVEKFMSRYRTLIKVNYREAVSKDVEVEVYVTLSTGYGESVKADVRRCIYNYVNGLGLGGRLYQSALVAKIMEIPGVEDVKISRLCFKGEEGVRDLIIENYQYLSVDFYDIKVVS